MSQKKTGLGTGDNPVPPSTFEYIDFGEQLSEPASSDIPNGTVAVYYRDGSLRMKPSNGDESEIGGGGGGGGGTTPSSSDVASTFAESDVTLSHTDTQVSGEAVELGSTIKDGSQVLMDYSSTETSNDVKGGFYFNPNTDLTGFRGHVDDNTSGATTGYLLDSSANVMASASISSGTFEIDHDLTSGTKYICCVDADGSNYERGYDLDLSFPKTSSDVDITGGWGGGDNNTPQSASGITAKKQGGATSGNALVHWGSAPSSVFEWVEATRDIAPDGETVTVDLEDAAGNVLYSDIPQNFSLISVDPSLDLRFRINLSRSDTSNNPSVTEVGRYWRPE